MHDGCMWGALWTQFVRLLLCLLQRTNRTSMPNIWIQGQPIGGCNDGPGLLTLARKGELAPMLKAAGAL